MIRKILFSAVILSLLGAIFIGFNASAKKNGTVAEVIGEVNEITDIAVSMLEENPTLETIQNTKKFLEERKTALREKIESVKLPELERSDPDLANKLKDCFDGNSNKFVFVYQNLLTRWYEDLNDVTLLREKLKKPDSISAVERQKLNAELAEKRAQVEKNIELINALNETTEMYKSIFIE